MEKDQNPKLLTSAMKKATKRDLLIILENTLIERNKLKERAALLNEEVGNTKELGITIKSLRKSKESEASVSRAKVNTLNGTITKLQKAVDEYANRINDVEDRNAELVRDIASKISLLENVKEKADRAIILIKEFNDLPWYSKMFKKL